MEEEKKEYLSDNEIVQNLIMEITDFIQSKNPRNIDVIASLTMLLCAVSIKCEISKPYILNQVNDYYEYIDSLNEK